MGMFDEYEPVPLPVCPVCGSVMAGCQGKDGPNALLVWRQGRAEPVRQHVDDEWKLDDAERVKFRLPQQFRFACWCANGHSTEFVGRSTEGMWTETEIAN